ncbi:MAG: hypothetical protein ABIQ10_16230 [Gemmatimonadaceae bacterium]
MRTSLTYLVALPFLFACSKSDNGSAAAARADSGAVTSTSKPVANAEMTERTADSVQAVGVPAAVADVGTHGEDLYDQAKASNWTKAGQIMDSLNRSAALLKPDERAQLSGTLDSLTRAVAAHQREVALEGANYVTLIGAKLTEAYHPKMPADIVRLDYYGRELEIWAARKNMTKLTSTAADLKRTWDAVKSSEISHGGTAPAAKMDQLVARLDAAKSVADYAQLAKPILDLVDALEKPFEK